MFIDFSPMYEKCIICYGSQKDTRSTMLLIGLMKPVKQILQVCLSINICFSFGREQR